ncbi:hypothetical protein KFU94_04185 [Chloroflexi bacterium TSY]|nr:hypothetical protein [Chloroflexi bacterium TSY]
MNPILLGALAGILTLLTLVVGVYAGITSFSLIFLILGRLSQSAAESSTPSGSAFAGLDAYLFDSFNNLLTGLWRDRWGFIPAGLLGGFTSGAYRFGLMLQRDRAWLISFTGMAIGVIVPVITWFVAQKAEIALLIAERPDIFSYSDQLSTPYALDIGLALVFGLPLTWVFWSIWRRWYKRLSFNYDDTNGNEMSNHFASSAEPPLNRFAQNHRLLAALLIIFLLCLLLQLPLKRYHDQASVRFQHGTVRLDAISSPDHEAPVSIQDNARTFTVVRRAGDGVVNIALRPSTLLSGKGLSDKGQTERGGKKNPP